MTQSYLVINDGEGGSFLVSFVAAAAAAVEEHSLYIHEIKGKQQQRAKRKQNCNRCTLLLMYRDQQTAVTAGIRRREIQKSTLPGQIK